MHPWKLSAILFECGNKTLRVFCGVIVILVSAHALTRSVLLLFIRIANLENGWVLITHAIVWLTWKPRKSSRADFVFILYLVQRNTFSWSRNQLLEKHQASRILNGDQVFWIFFFRWHKTRRIGTWMCRGCPWTAPPSHPHQVSPKNKDEI